MEGGSESMKVVVETENTIKNVFPNEDHNTQQRKSFLAFSPWTSKLIVHRTFKMLCPRGYDTFSFSDLHFQIIARRGIHKSLFHATKKWFGGNKPNAHVASGLNVGSRYSTFS